MARSSQPLLRQVRRIRRKIESERDSEAAVDYAQAARGELYLTGIRLDRANSWASRHGYPEVEG